jgi:hypothetical protein
VRELRKARSFHGFMLQLMSNSALPVQLFAGCRVVGETERRKAREASGQAERQTAGAGKQCPELTHGDPLPGGSRARRAC